jgi:hypothetical protein
MIVGSAHEMAERMFDDTRQIAYHVRSPEMDWTMVANANDSRHRILTLAYLLMERYRANEEEAGRRLAEEPGPNQLRDTTIEELRLELATPSADLAYVRFRTDQEVRQYLQRFLNAYDRFSESR